MLRAGIEAFGTTAYDDVRVSDIASETGVAAGLPFHYFASKRGYYLEVLRYVAVLMRDVLDVPSTLPPGAAVRAMLTAHCEWLESHPLALRELLRGSLGSDPEARAVYEEGRWDGMARLLHLVGADDPDARTRLMIEGWVLMKDDVMMRWIDNPAIPREEMIELLVRALSDLFASLGRPEVADRLARRN